MSPDTESIQPLILHGSNISYFTGKLENYFRLRGIPYQLCSMQFPADKKRMEQEVGLMQMPVLELGDGRWMTDSTSIIQWFEAEYPGNGLVPENPLLAYFCLLIEDWADEWWWRPAMHYRWHYAEGAMLQSRHLVDETLAGVPLPGGLKRWFMRHRQRSGYTTGDGITPQGVAGVEALFLQLLAQLQAIFSRRPFLLGDRPSLADVGLSGPFFRHFALDPVPLEIIRVRAPAVLEWVARLWNTRLAECDGAWPQSLPDDIEPLLADIGASYLPYLNANARAVAAGHRRFDSEVGGVSYKRARCSRYRVWCLKQLRSHYNALGEHDRRAGREVLERTGCWEPLWRERDLPLLPGQEQGLPFRASTKMLAVNE
ncbi:glutathione S-transferase [Seongchinamella unica]|uniref:Glutathione S-transferase n=1 Tax=Seongchinamella unica TaxID=2547392 RepID=A0A4R5LRG3_9GAMM|nr:glutathione S-transferase family protein [Seongchinamella unica]TDG13468.1 glutathione S-transferase [Seongchinamella unica]